MPGKTLSPRNRGVLWLALAAAALLSAVAYAVVGASAGPDPVGVADVAVPSALGLVGLFAIAGSWRVLSKTAADREEAEEGRAPDGRAS